MSRLFALLLAAGLLPLPSAPAQMPPRQRLPDGGSGPTVPQYKAEAFIGTWEWRSSSDVFRLTISRELRFPLPDGRTMHFLIGRHSYTRNGVVVEESYSNRPNDPTGRSFLGAPNQEWVFYAGYIDRTKNKGGDATMTIDPNNADQIQFELHEREGMYTSKHPAPAEGFTIPATMTLIRVP